MNDHKCFVLGFSFSVLLMTFPLQASPIDPDRHPHPENTQEVHEAEHAVDSAWKIYHRAALGGTVASPALQAEIEEHLHQARALITRVQDAAERGDTRQIKHLVGQLKIHTSQAIEGSKEQKK